MNCAYQLIVIKENRVLGKDDTKQVERPIFLEVPQTEQIPKVKEYK